MPSPTPEQLNRKYSFVSNPERFQYACREAVRKHIQHTEANGGVEQTEKIRRERDSAMPGFFNDTPSFIFYADKKGNRRMYALARDPSIDGNSAIGAGAFGRVKLVLEIEEDGQGNYKTGEIGVVKIERSRTEDLLREETFTREAGILLADTFERESTNIAKGTQYKYYTTIKFLGVSLRKLLDVKQLAQLSLDNRLDIAIQLCEQVSMIHIKGIIHHDIKPDNITIEESEDGLHVHLIDYGLATRDDNNDENFHRQFCLRGSPAYMMGFETKGDRVRNITIYGKYMSFKAKDIVALLRTLLMADNVNIILPPGKKQPSLFTSQEVSSFLNEFKNLIMTETISRAREIYDAVKTNDMALQLAALFVMTRLEIKDSKLFNMVMMMNSAELKPIMEIYHDQKEDKVQRLSDYFSQIYLIKNSHKLIYAMRDTVSSVETTRIKLHLQDWALLLQTEKNPLYLDSFIMAAAIPRDANEGEFGSTGMVTKFLQSFQDSDLAPILEQKIGKLKIKYAQIEGDNPIVKTLIKAIEDSKRKDPNQMFGALLPTTQTHHLKELYINYVASCCTENEDMKRQALNAFVIETHTSDIKQDDNIRAALGITDVQPGEIKSRLV